MGIDRLDYVKIFQYINILNIFQIRVYCKIIDFHKLVLSTTSISQLSNRKHGIDNG